MRRIGVEERRARLGVRHRLVPAARTSDVAEIAGSVVALHATDPATVVLSALARMPADGTIGAVERALYDDRSVVRMLGMRRTLFVVPVELLPVVHASSTLALVPPQRRLAIKLIETAGVATDGESWLAEVEHDTLAALRARGEAKAAELADLVPKLQQEVVVAPGKPYESRQRLTSRVLFNLGLTGKVVRGRRIGSWISGQNWWAATEAWLPDLPAGLSVADAQADLAGRWLASHGPATAADLKWWTGWKVTDVRRALAALGAVDVDLDGTAGVVLPDDLEPVESPEPWVALLPGLDPTSMGWSQRDWYLGEHKPAVFDTNGNAGPTVWCDGRIVGSWGMPAAGEIAFRIYEDVGSEATAAIESAAETLSTQVGNTKVTPRFRTPAEREIAATGA